MSKDFRYFLIGVVILIVLAMVGLGISYLYPAQGLFDTRCWNEKTRTIDQTKGDIYVDEGTSFLQCVRYGVGYIVYS